MPPSSAVIDWETLKPEILRLLSAGKTRKDVIAEVSMVGPSITKSQLEYQIKCWGLRVNLTEQAWRFTSHKIQKRARNKKKSAVFFNNALIPSTKVDKETRRHVRPTMLPESSASPTCPEGFDLMICTPISLAVSPISSTTRTSTGTEVILFDSTRIISSLPWPNYAHNLRTSITSVSMRMKVDILSLNSLNLPKPSELPVALVDFCGMPKRSLGVETLGRSQIDLLEGSEMYLKLAREVKSREEEPSASEISTRLGLHVYQISNNLSTGYLGSDMERLYIIGERFKLVAETTSNWKSLLIAGVGVTSTALIEQLFGFSMISRDEILAKLMLQIGADPNQQMSDGELGSLSALDYTLTRTIWGISDLLLDAGAVYDQMTLKHAIMTRNFIAADRILNLDQSLDLDFNYLDSLSGLESHSLGHLQLEETTLLGLVCLKMGERPCECTSWNGPTIPSTYYHPFPCPRNPSIVSLEFLIKKGAKITLDTMILASFNADLVTLRFLMQQGGSVEGFNSFGFSCLDAASLRQELQFDIFSILVASGATVNITRTDHALDSRASLLHLLLLAGGLVHQYWDNALNYFQIFDLFITMGADINYRVRQIGSPEELALAYETFLWSQSTQYVPPADIIAYSKAESPLEYAIIVGCERSALYLITLGCHLTGREITLAVKMGSISVLQALIGRDRSGFEVESVGRTILRLSLRWGHEYIVRYLLGKGVKFGGYDIMDALQYTGRSLLRLYPETQIELIHATPELDRLQIFGVSLLELCSLKFQVHALRHVLGQFPAAFDSGALSAIAIRALRHEGWHQERLNSGDIQIMGDRRTGTNSDWETENTALLMAATCKRYGPDVLRILVPPGTACAVKTARIPRKYFSIFLDPQFPEPYVVIDPTYILSCQDWVFCSPLIGVAMAPHGSDDWSTGEDMLNHLLACSYEPDALTVVTAAARGNLRMLRRLRLLQNWQSILSIDDDSRPVWCPTALQAAAWQNNDEIVKLLLEAGTSVNEAPATEPIGNVLPRTALQAAVDSDNMRLTNLLIEHGACINAPAAEDSGATALQLACIHGYLTISLRLLELGADVNARGAEKHGRTALEGAAEHGRIDTIQLLLSYGVCTDGLYREQYLKSVLYARKNHHFAAADLLKEHREWSAEDEECYRNLQSAGWDNEEERIHEIMGYGRQHWSEACQPDGNLNRALRTVRWDRFRMYTD